MLAPLPLAAPWPGSAGSPARRGGEWCGALPHAAPARWRTVRTLLRCPGPRASPETGCSPQACRRRILCLPCAPLRAWARPDAGRWRGAKPGRFDRLWDAGQNEEITRGCRRHTICTHAPAPPRLALVRVRGAPLRLGLGIATGPFQAFGAVGGPSRTRKPLAAKFLSADAPSDQRYRGRRLRTARRT